MLLNKVRGQRKYLLYSNIHNHKYQHYVEKKRTEFEKQAGIDFLKFCTF